MDNKDKGPADLLEQALKDLEERKRAARELARQLEPEIERLAELQKKLASLPQHERRQVLDAAGMTHVSAAPRPMAPIQDTGGTIATHSRPSPEPNWKEWIHTPEVRVWQACALSLNINPHSMVQSRNGWMAGPGIGPVFDESSFPDKQTREEFELRQRLLLANLSDQEHFSGAATLASAPGNTGVKLAEFAYWAVVVIALDDVPPTLVDLACEQSDMLYPRNERITPFDTPRQSAPEAVQPSSSRSGELGIVRHTLQERRDILDPAIDKAISLAGSHETAEVFLALRTLALNEEPPFSGSVEKDALCFTDSSNNPKRLTKDALNKRLKRRQEKLR